MDAARSSDCGLLCCFVLTVDGDQAVVEFKKTAIVAESSSSASRLQDLPSLHPHMMYCSVYAGSNEQSTARSPSGSLMNLMSDRGFQTERSYSWADLRNAL